MKRVFYLLPAPFLLGAHIASARAPDLSSSFNEQMISGAVQSIRGGIDASMAAFVRDYEPYWSRFTPPIDTDYSLDIKIDPRKPIGEPARIVSLIPTAPIQAIGRARTTKLKKSMIQISEI